MGGIPQTLWQGDMEDVRLSRTHWYNTSLVGEVLDRPGLMGPLDTSPYRQGTVLGSRLGAEISSSFSKFESRYFKMACEVI